MPASTSRRTSRFISPYLRRWNTSDRMTLASALSLRCRTPPPDCAERERRCEAEHDESEERVQSAHPPVPAGEADLHRSDHSEQQREAEVAARQPRADR